MPKSQSPTHSKKQKKRSRNQPSSRKTMLIESMTSALQSLLPTYDYEKLRTAVVRYEKQSLSWLKEKAWGLYSERLRRKAADWKGFEACFTCQKSYHWKTMQAGHFVSGRHNAVLFDDRNVHPQCYRCNIKLSGNWPAYYERMRRVYGQLVIDELLDLNQTERIFSKLELIAKIVEIRGEISSIS